MPIYTIINKTTPYNRLLIIVHIEIVPHELEITF